MEYLFDNPRILFVLLLLAIYAVVILLMAGVHWIAAKVTKAKRLAAAPQGRNPEDADICCPGGLPNGACSCR